MFPPFRVAKEQQHLGLPTSTAGLEHPRKMSYPLAHSSRVKDRRWPLVLRFHKGAIHGAILGPILVHAAIAALVVYVNKRISYQINLPNSIIPSLSIVVGLMLVFRNQTAYSRFWEGRLHLNTVTTSVRCLTRQILVLSPPPPPPRRHFVGSGGAHVLRRARTQSVPDLTSVPEAESKNADDEAAAAKVVETVKVLIAMLYTIKTHLRADWGVALSCGSRITEDGQVTSGSEFADLLPKGLKGYEHRGLALTLELSVFVESFIAMGTRRNWFHNAAAAQMLAALNSLVRAYGQMEVIRLTPMPVAHLVHHEQVLALFCISLSLAMAAEMGWWAVPLLAFVSFTLYGIEGIAQTYKDPFGTHKIDIRMDDIVADARREIEVLLAVWENQENHHHASSNGDCDRGRVGCSMFVPHMTRLGSVSSGEDGRGDDGDGGSVRESRKGDAGVRWLENDIFTNEARLAQSWGNVPPVNFGFQDSLEEEGSLGARRVTWGSSVGENDMGVFAAPTFFEGTLAT